MENKTHKEVQPDPKVSVIIPFFNNHREVEEIVGFINKQTYPTEKLEIICIDNGSTKPYEFDPEFKKNCLLLVENQHQSSPYSARNRGIEAASGSVIVFADANSYPDERWLENGVRYLQESQADIAAGAVDFHYGDKVTAAKIADALTSINMQKSVAERGVGYTANLFVKKEIFEIIGGFEEGVRSGGDVRWCLQAKKAGYTIMYAQEAVVYKKARPVKELYRKKIRTGRGYFFTWKNEKNRTLWFYNLFRSLKPPGLADVKNLNPDRYRDEFESKRFFVWFHLYVAGIVEQLSFVYQFFAYTLGAQRDIDRRKSMEQNQSY